ncbi:MAG: hypothetical protein ACR2JF_13815 [Iamia sp.]
MAITRWTNQSLPQTLQIGMILLYIDAVFGVVFGEVLFFPIGTALVVGAAAGGLGIANEKRWGWVVGVAVSAVAVLFNLMFFTIFGLMFAVAQLALLVHPQSREHQKVWFT